MNPRFLRKLNRIELEANALAEKERRIAKGKADAMREIDQATREAQSNPLFFKMKMLEVERNRIEKWNGEYPRWFMGDGATTGLLFQLPTMETSHQ